MHISKRNVTKGGCNSVDNTHTHTPALTRQHAHSHASTTFYLRPVIQTRCDCTRCIPSSKFYLNKKGATISHGAILQVWCHIQACAKQSCYHTDFQNLKKDHNHVHYLSVWSKHLLLHDSEQTMQSTRGSMSTICGCSNNQRDRSEG